MNRQKPINLNRMEEKLFSTALQGWQCPICKRVYSPFTQMCLYCGKQEIHTNIYPNTGGFVKEQSSALENQITE